MGHNTKMGFWTGAADPKYILSQMYGWSACHSLVEEYENQNNFEYDHIIKLRLDFKIRPTTRKELSSSLFDPKHYIRIPDPSRCGHPKHIICTICDDQSTRNLTYEKHKHFHDTDVCDIIAHGNREVMKTYLTTFNFWEDILEEMHQDNISLLSKLRFAGETLSMSFAKMVVPWAGLSYRNCCDIHIHDNMKINCFYPERFLLYRAQKFGT